MRRIFLFLSLAILLTTFPMKASAAGIKVIMNDEAIVFTARPFILVPKYLKSDNRSND